MAAVWVDDAARGSWRLLVDGRIAAVVVHHRDGWRGFVNPGGVEVPGAPFETLEAAQAGVETWLGS